MTTQGKAYVYLLMLFLYVGSEKWSMRHPESHTCDNMDLSLAQSCFLNQIYTHH